MSRPVGLFTQSLNDVIDLHTTRLAAARNHVPDSVIVMLFLLAMISMGLVAFDSVVQDKRGSGALVVTAILTAGVLAVVIDMDQPWLGFLVIDQAPLTDLLRSISIPPKG